MKRILKYVLFFVCLVLLLALQFSCSPEKRLNRLVRNHPELVKTDTVKKPVFIQIPAQRKDTLITLNHDFSGLYAILDRYRMYIDSAKSGEIITEVKKYVIERPAIKDTLIIPLQNKGMVKIWQAGSKLAFFLDQPAYTKTVIMPVVTVTVSAPSPSRWPVFVGGFFAGWLALFCFILIHKPKTNERN